MTQTLTGPASISLALRLAVREMRGGLKGFYIFVFCILIGTAAIAGVNSVARSMTDAIAEKGQEILAGDIRFGLKNREASTEERAYIESLGKISVSSSMRSMVRRADQSDQALAELKAVDGAYPLYGRLESQPAKPLAELLDRSNGQYGALAQQTLLDRLNLKIGDNVILGSLTLKIRGIVISEPDQLSEGFGFAPRLLISRDALVQTGLLQTGSLVDHYYRVKYADVGLNPGKVRKEAEARFPEAGWSIRGARNAAPSLSQSIDRFSDFLTLVGLAALAAGGVGVANAVGAYLDSKRQVIASFKCLGAPGHLILMIYMIQILMIAILAIGLGLLLGAAIPVVAGHYLSGMLPVATDRLFYPRELVLAAIFGLLTAIAFSILPLGRARLVPATELFRSQSFDGWQRMPIRYFLAAIVAFAAIAALAILTTGDRFIATSFLVATAGAFVVLRIVATLVSFAARRAPKVSSPALRLALGNIHRPGALTAPVVLSLGLGLTLLATLALVEGNLKSSLSGALAEKAPNFFFIDIQGRDRDGFDAIVVKNSPGGAIVEVPMMRGRILAFNGVEVSKKTVPQSARWVLEGDRGITYAEKMPSNASLADGQWWSSDYSGEPLVSFAAEEGHELGLKLGDTVTVNVLGRNITAKIANFRNVEWRSMSINFVMVFSPNTFRGAPHAWLATLTNPQATAKSDAAVMKAVTNAYPGITTIRTKDALDIAVGVISQIATGIRAAASIALAVSVLVLAGAIAAGNRARIHDAVILKTLGARRTLLIRAYLYEYALLAAAASMFALVAAAGAAWYVITSVMGLPFTFLAGTAVSTLAAGFVITAGTGLIGTWSVLGQKAAPVLREL